MFLYIWNWNYIIWDGWYWRMGWQAMWSTPYFHFAFFFIFDVFVSLLYTLIRDVSKLPLDTKKTKLNSTPNRQTWHIRKKKKRKNEPFSFSHFSRSWTRYCNSVEEFQTNEWCGVAIPKKHIYTSTSMIAQKELW